jgi:S-adenosylmethionine:tRNA-ribosyltransferase-isomerase (queuine synthetase)
MQVSGGEVHKDRFVSTGALSLNGHDSSYIMSAQTAVLRVPTLGCKITNMQLTDFHNPAGQNMSLVFLFADSMKCHSKLSLAISLLKLSSSLVIL